MKIKMLLEFVESYKWSLSKESDTEYQYDFIDSNGNKYKVDFDYIKYEEIWELTFRAFNPEKNDYDLWYRPNVNPFSVMKTIFDEILPHFIKTNKADSIKIEGVDDNAYEVESSRTRMYKRHLKRNLPQGWDIKDNKYGNKSVFYLNKINMNENFTFGDLSDFDKSDLEEELSYYKNWYEFYEEENEEIHSIIKGAINNFKTRIPIFKQIHVQLVKNFGNNRRLQDALAMYVHDSVHKTPIIILSVEAIYKANDDGYGLETIIEPTIYHELGHAMVQIDNEIEFIENQNILHFDDEEDFVEDFAFNFSMFGKIDDEFLELSKLYNERQS